MATDVLIHGAGSDSWYWHRVRPELERHGHDVVVPDLPCDDDSAGLLEYRDAVLDSATAGTWWSWRSRWAASVLPSCATTCRSTSWCWWPRWCRVPASRRGTGGPTPVTSRRSASRTSATARPTDRDFDPVVTFLHDVPPVVVAESAEHVRPQSGTPFEQPWPLDAWPSVPTRFLLCTNDRFFPADFQRRVVRERLGIIPDEIESGHLPALSHPTELAERLEASRIERAGTHRHR